MRIALVSPYDWAVPGGVNNHIRPLAAQFIRAGHEVRIIAPSSRRWSHRCDYLTVIGEHVIGLPAAGSVASVCLSFNTGPRVKALLARLRGEGRTLFFTSHALADIEEICDRMVVLHQGVPYFSGAPRALCEHYGENSTERAFLRCIGTPAHV